MSAALNPGDSSELGADRDRVWVSAPLARDLAVYFAWDFLLGSVFYLVLVGGLFGESGVAYYLWVLPVVGVLIVPGALFFFLPTSTARRISVAETGLAVVRFRSVEEFPWRGVKPGHRRIPRWAPFSGGKYPISLSGDHPPITLGLSLTREQAELVAAHLGGTVEQVWRPRENAPQRS